MTDSMVYAMRGSLVVEIEEWNSRGMAPTEVDRMMTRLLARSGVRTSA